jgi:5-methylcytosine-specific restriction endonuclease McrA
MTCVVALNYVEFSPAFGIWVLQMDLTQIIKGSERWVDIARILAEEDGVDSDRVLEEIDLALEYIDDPMLRDACFAGAGPLGDLGRVTFDRFIEIIEAERTKLATKAAKQSLTRQRRSEFGAVRPQLALALLNAGHQYTCAAEGCSVTVDLTIDHIVPLSRGGTDDLENLRFLCRPHNSAKGDR